MLKKWAFIIGFVTIGLFFSGLKADASTVNVTGATNFNEIVQGRPYVTFMYPNGKYAVFFVSEGSKFYVSGDNITSTANGYGLIYEYYPDTNRLADLTNDSTRSISKTYQLLQTDVGIYSDSSLESFFFNVPNPYVVRGVGTVEEIPMVMKQSLVDGGLISTGLTVLAILLGVFLVPRLIYSFLR